MSDDPQSAVVFAYSDVGVRGLCVLLAHGVDVRAVITHPDDPGERIWFASVARLAEWADLRVLSPLDINDDAVIAEVRAAKPDWIFSFYCRQLLGRELLSIARRGAYNLHGSLLPRYRGRAPVNWAILNGESVTGASLHRMTAQPDAGDLVDQQAVPILPNDSALDVHRKVTWAAESVLHRSLPDLLAGTAREHPLDLRRGSYFGGRTPDDGRIDWSRPAQQVHNLIRAVAPPFPGAFADTACGRLVLLGSYFRHDAAAADAVRIYWQGRGWWADCADGKRLRILGLELNGEPLDRSAFADRFGDELILA